MFVSRKFAEHLFLFIFGATTVLACQDSDKLDISAGSRQSNGNIALDGVVFELGDYSVDNVTGVATACPKPVVKKCCPFGFGSLDGKCVSIPDNFDVDVWGDYSRLDDVKARETFRFKMEKMNCSPYVRVLVSDLGEDQSSDIWRLKSDGKLFVELTNKIPPWTLLNSDKYCIDTFIYGENGVNKTRLDALACFEDESPPNNFEIRSACMLTSCVFILVTVVVYAWLPELRNMHGRVLMAYLLCLFLGFLCMSTMQIMLTIDNITRSICATLTIIIYFALEAAFFWLNVMSFDIWWTFSGKGGMGTKKATKRFALYFLYAFGVPTILTIVLVSLEFSGLKPHPLLPMIRYQGCFLFGTSKLLYLYGPMLILCLANIVFFIMTAQRISEIKQETAVLKSKESATHDQHKKDKQRLLLYVKLFTVMGINWILEVISAIYPQWEIVWNLTDTYNVLIGVTIFFIFVCKKKIFRMIKKRYKQIKGEPMSRTQTISTRTTSSRDDVRMSSVKY